jgi:inosose dehydratase
MAAPHAGIDRGGEGAVIAAKIAGAPISWGVCEVPGWGHRISADRVLREMSIAGLTATELGPQGYLPTQPAQLRALLRSHGLRCAGTFAPVLLHDTDHDPVADIAGRLDVLNACAADVLVLAAATGADGYDSRPTLEDAQWNTLLANLDRLADVAARRGVLAVLHPHVGTMVETPDDVERVLAGSSVRLCLDTGHLLIGGTDPVALARAVPDRIGHVHLKDVAEALAARV